jgi:hypothetical protein
LEYFVVIWFILWLFGLFCGYLVYFVVILYIIHQFWFIVQEKTGNPDVVSSLPSEIGAHEIESRRNVHWVVAFRKKALVPHSKRSC